MKSARTVLKSTSLIVAAILAAASLAGSADADEEAVAGRPDRPSAPAATGSGSAPLSPGPCELPGRPAMDGTDDRVLRGYVLAWAVNSDGVEIKWNHLAGNATIVNYREGSAWEYSAWASHAVNPVIDHGQPTGFSGELDLNELEFAPPYSHLLLNFQAVDSAAFGQEGVAQVISDTDLTLHPVTIDLRQNHQPPVTTKASFDIWNQWEARFSGTHRCITCWDQTLLGLYDSPNHFNLQFLQTDHGKARIEGAASAGECPESTDAALLGVAARQLVFDGGLDYAHRRQQPDRDGKGKRRDSL